MPVTISIPDSVRQAVEAASNGHNTVLYDDKGNPSVMVVIPRFRMDDIDPSLPPQVHPAFVVGGVVKPEIFVGKFAAAVHDGRAVSVPTAEPTAWVTWDQARQYCAAKGYGWHLMTNAEWAAVALYCWRRGYQPHGNTGWGLAHSDRLAAGRRVDGAEPGLQAGPAGGARVLTGSGPTTWTHDGSEAGIYDLVGNVWEWQAGVRLLEGEIQVIPNNDAAINTVDQGAASAAWRAIAQNGALVAPGTAGSLKYDGPAPINAPPPNTPIEVSDEVRNPQSGTGYSTVSYKDLGTHAGVTVPNLLQQLALFPLNTDIEAPAQWFSVRTFGERVIARGGDSTAGAGAGLFSVYGGALRTWNAAHIGFRAAYFR